MHDVDLTLQTIAPDHLAYPAALKTCVAFKTPPILNAIGNLELLTQNEIASSAPSNAPVTLSSKPTTSLKPCEIQKLPSSAVSTL
jgi:hypothetical protein